MACNGKTKHFATFCNFVITGTKLSTCSWCKDLPKRERAKEKLREKKLEVDKDLVRRKACRDEFSNDLDKILNVLPKVKLDKGTELEVNMRQTRVQVGKKNQGQGNKQVKADMGAGMSKELVKGDFLILFKIGLHVYSVFLEFCLHFLSTYFLSWYGL